MSGLRQQISDAYVEALRTSVVNYCLTSRRVAERFGLTCLEVPHRRRSGRIPIEAEADLNFLNRLKCIYSSQMLVALSEWEAKIVCNQKGKKDERKAALHKIKQTTTVNKKDQKLLSLTEVLTSFGNRV